MNKLFWQTAKAAPIVFAASLMAANGASAQTITAEKESINNTLQQINNYQKSEPSGLSQVTNVNQLRDVSPTDWAYEALRSLVDRYGCISGFPNQTYRGNQPLSRYEFAAGLNSCLNQIERLIASQEAVGQEDIDTISRLSQEFEAELATIGGRVDEIESRTAVLEDSQFSTTTILKGEAIFGLADAFGGGADLSDFEDEAVVGDGDLNDDGVSDDLNGDGTFDSDEIEQAEDDTELDEETTFSQRVRLNFDTSFFGKDRLRTRLQSGNFDRFDTGTNSTRFGFDTSTDGVEVSDLHYRFSPIDGVRVWVGPQGLDLDDIFEVSNPALASGGSGAVSRFSRRNPIVFRGTEGAGAGINFGILNDTIGINALYLTDDANDPDQGEGLGSGSFSAGAQLEFNLFDVFDITATYVRNFQTGDDVNQSGSTVSSDIGLNGDGLISTGGNATEPFGEIDTVANKFGVGTSFDLGNFAIAGWGGYADVEGIVDGDDNNPTGDIWSWGANVSLQDLVKEGTLLSVAGGMIPKFTSDDAVAAGNLNGLQEDRDTSYLLEALFKVPVGDNISITPGVIAVINPNHLESNDTVYVGTVRTTFRF